MHRFLAIAGLLLTSLAFANLAPPPKKGTDAKLTVRYSFEARAKPILRIPAAMLKAEARPASMWDNTTRIILPGLMLSLAMILAGYWMVKRKRGMVPAVAAIALIIFVSLAALADLPRNNAKRPTPPPPVDTKLTDTIGPALRAVMGDNGELAASIQVQVVPNGTEVELLLPKPMKVLSPGND
jgi:hypothetical protein